ncbi:transporter anion:cation symporter (ACS) family [Klebsiella quasipneumoniae]|nr:transporter anion:cation symporter (ACS) family [Klebsiella quasipneumoniae]
MSMSNSQEVLTSSSGTKKRSRVRIVILLLLSVGTMINYLDRTILGIVAPQLTQEIHIDPAMMGIIFSAFAWTYALAQIPGGMFLDRFGNKLTYALQFSSGRCLPCCKVSPSGLNLCCFCAWDLASVKRPASRPTAASSAPGSRSMSAHGRRQHIRLVNI